MTLPPCYRCQCQPCECVDGITLYHGLAEEIVPLLAPQSVTAVVTDPPAGISFMGRAWDSAKGGRDKWIAWLCEILTACRAACKPGAPLLCWALPRTSHWTGMAIEDAGWEVVDQISHLFGSGFPKALDISKAIDKAAGAERGVVGVIKNDQPTATDIYGGFAGEGRRDTNITAPATPEAQRLDGWHTSTKPAHETWWMAFNPYEAVTSDRLHTATGWDFWHHDKAVKHTIVERLKVFKRYGVRLPSGCYEVEVRTLRRRALHAAVESDLLFQVRAVVPTKYKPAWRTVGRADVKAYRKWKSSSVAANALTHGVAGLAIDRSRVEAPDGLTTGGRCVGESPLPMNKAQGHSEERERSPEHSLGRYPPNVVLSHAPGCRKVGTRKVKGSNRPSEVGRTGSMGYGRNASGSETRADYADPDGLETIDAWECVEGCPVLELGRQSGERPSAGAQAAGPGMFGLPRDNRVTGRGDTGTAARFFPQFGGQEQCETVDTATNAEPNSESCSTEKSGARPAVSTSDITPTVSGTPTDSKWKSVRFHYCPKAGKSERHDSKHPTVKPLELMSWLCKLVSMPGYTGTLLDPFAGSGSTLEAGTRWFEHVIGIEQDEGYCKDIVRRLKSRGGLF